MESMMELVIAYLFVIAIIFAPRPLTKDDLRKIERRKNDE